MIHCRTVFCGGGPSGETQTKMGQEVYWRREKREQQGKICKVVGRKIMQYCLVFGNQKNSKRRSQCNKKEMGTGVKGHRKWEV